MVKGISRQVIVLQSPETRMFDQAIFILKDGTPAVTDEDLLREADRLINSAGPGGRRKLSLYGPVWACGGAVLTGAAWLLSVLL